MTWAITADSIRTDRQKTTRIDIIITAIRKAGTETAGEAVKRQRLDDCRHCDLRAVHGSEMFLLSAYGRRFVIDTNVEFMYTLLYSTVVWRAYELRQIGSGETAETNPRGGSDIVRTLGVFFIETKRGNEDE
jgi:hypothetical protein